SFEAEPVSTVPLLAPRVGSARLRAGLDDAAAEGDRVDDRPGSLAVEAFREAWRIAVRDQDRSGKSQPDREPLSGDDAGKRLFARRPGRKDDGDIAIVSRFER